MCPCSDWGLYSLGFLEKADATQFEYVALLRYVERIGVTKFYSLYSDGVGRFGCSTWLSWCEG